MFKSGLSYSGASIDEKFDPSLLERIATQPIKFVEHNFADYIWGGYELYKLKKIDIRDHHPAVAESWEISGHEKYPSIVTLPNGDQIPLPDLLNHVPIARKILGHAVFKRFSTNFPLIIKFFDVQKHMSVQVHPSDEVAKSFGEKDPGKGEIFIVLDVYPGAEGVLYLGLKDGVTRDQLEQALRNGDNLLDLMHKIRVKKGEIYELPSGVIHCWTGGTMAVEITEASDLTYRLYDFGRGRPMHYEKGLASIDFENQNGRSLEKQTRVQWDSVGTPGLQKLHTQSEMAVERICLDSKIRRVKTVLKRPSVFEAILCLKGAAKLKAINGTWTEPIAQGYALLLPSESDNYTAELDKGDSRCEFLKISMELKR